MLIILTLFDKTYALIRKTYYLWIYKYINGTNNTYSLPTVMSIDYKNN